LRGRDQDGTAYFDAIRKPSLVVRPWSLAKAKNDQIR